MATLTLKIGNMTSEMKFNNDTAKEICGRAWDAYHSKDEETTEQEKLDWVLEVLLVKALERASTRKDTRDERDKRKAEHDAARELRKNTPRLK